MSDHALRLAEHLLARQVDDLTDRERGVIERAVRSHRSPSPSLTTIDTPLRWHERLSDRVAAVGGSWSFIIAFALALSAWALLNSWLLTQAFDPYPYIFLNLLLSMLAAIQAPVIMMSQNRMAAHDRVQARRDFEVNLKAELEILALHTKLDRLIAAANAGRADAAPAE